MMKQTPSNLNQEPFESDRWAMIIALLSMDVVISFENLMGFALSDQKTFVAVMRSIILEMRREHSAGGSFYSPKLLSEGLASGLGVELSAHLAWWGEHIFEKSPQDHQELHAWRSTLRHCRHYPLLWNELGLPSSLSGNAQREFLRSIDTTEYQQRNAQVYAQSLSDWDLHMYALNGFDDENELAPSGPGSYLYPTVLAYQGYRFWVWMLKRLNAEQRAALRRNATCIAQNTKSLRFLGELPDTSCLDVGLRSEPYPG